MKDKKLILTAFYTSFASTVLLTLTLYFFDRDVLSGEVVGLVLFYLVVMTFVFYKVEQKKRVDETKKMIRN